MLFGSGRPGLILYQPIYRNGVVPQTVAARRRALHGFAAGEFAISALAKALNPPSDSSLEITERGRRLFGSRSSAPTATAAATYAGQPWSGCCRERRRSCWRQGSRSRPRRPALLLVFERRERYTLRMVRLRLAERDRAERDFRLLALTGLFNQRSFKRELAREQAASRRSRTLNPVGQVGSPDTALAEVDHALVLRQALRRRGRPADGRTGRGERCRPALLRALHPL